MFPVVLARCGSYERARVFDALARAVDLLGGVSKFVQPGTRVLVKPNLLFARPKEAAVTTHPEVVRAVVELAAQAGASEVLVGDSPGLAKAASVAKACGLTEALAGTGAKLVEFDETAELRGEVFPKLVLARRAVEADVVINVAKAKAHVHTALTLSTKNCFGCVPGLAKSQWHLRAGRDRLLFSRLLVDVARTVRPCLNVIDAVVAMEGNGPGNGTPRKLGAFVVGESPFAADMAAARLLGFSREEIPLEKAALQMGEGPRGTDDLDLLGEPLKDLSVSNFARAVRRDVGFSIRMPGFIVRALRKYATPRPVIDGDTCRRCGRCAEICPPKAITMQEDCPPEIDDDVCIRCFCCQEICPFGAISAKAGVLARFFTR